MKQNDLIRVVSGKNRSAIRWAIEAHQGQKRKGHNVDYVTHPIAVAEVGAAVGLDRNGVCACILHDVVEDSNKTLDNIREEFGSHVALLIEGLTKDDEFKRTRLENHAQLILNKAEKLSLQFSDVEEEQEHFLFELLAVKGCDLLVNMTDLVLDYEQKGDASFTEIFGYSRVERKISHYLELSELISIKLKNSVYGRLSDALRSRSQELSECLASFLNSQKPEK